MLTICHVEDHCQIMRYMGLDQDSVIILHMGVRCCVSLESEFHPIFTYIIMQGMYGDKESAVERFKQNYTTRLTDEMKARLVLENDEVRSSFQFS